MRSEEGLDNVVGRNITSNFFPGAMLVDINNTPEAQEQFEALQKSLRQFVGDENLGNLFLCQVKSKEEIPQKIDLTSENYDAAFSVSQKYLPDAIGRVFNQPPILRAEDVGANFGADLMTNAYKFYNTQTEEERSDVETGFGKIFPLWYKPEELTDSEISPLYYVVAIADDERLSENDKKEIIALLANKDIDNETVAEILCTLYGFEVDHAVKMVKYRKT